MPVCNRFHYSSLLLPLPRLGTSREVLPFRRDLVLLLKYIHFTLPEKDMEASQAISLNLIYSMGKTEEKTKNDGWENSPSIVFLFQLIRKLRFPFHPLPKESGFRTLCHAAKS